MKDDTIEIEKNLEDSIIAGKIRTKVLRFDVKEKILYVNDYTSFITRSLLYALNMGMHYKNIDKIMIIKISNTNSQIEKNG